MLGLEHLTRRLSRGGVSSVCVNAEACLVSGIAFEPGLGEKAERGVGESVFPRLAGRSPAAEERGGQHAAPEKVVCAPHRHGGELWLPSLPPAQCSAEAEGQQFPAVAQPSLLARSEPAGGWPFNTSLWRALFLKKIK